MAHQQTGGFRDYNEKFFTKKLKSPPVLLHAGLDSQGLWFTQAVLPDLRSAQGSHGVVLGLVPDLLSLQSPQAWDKTGAWWKGAASPSKGPWQHQVPSHRVVLLRLQSSGTVAVLQDKEALPSSWSQLCFLPSGQLHIQTKSTQASSVSLSLPPQLHHVLGTPATTHSDRF